MSPSDRPAPLSYWHETAPQLVLSPDLPTRVDVAVIGGGLLGASTCYWLARGRADVVLLERNAPAYGATGRNGGFVAVGTAESYPDAIARLGHETARAVWTFTLENRALLRQVLAEEEIACDYREPGSLHMSLGDEQYAALERTVAAMRADGFAADLLDRTQVQSSIGTPLSLDITGGEFLPGNGLVHSARLVQGLLQAAMRHGAKAALAEVTQLVPDGTGIRIETSQGISVHARSVAIAVNPWTGELLPAVAPFITPVRGQVLAYAPSAPVFQMGMAASMTRTGEYWQQTVDGSIVVGGCRDFAQGHDVNVRTIFPTPEVQTPLEQVIPHLFPALSDLRVKRRWAGLMGFTRDYIPIVDAVPHLPGAWFVGGFSGHGMPFGIRLGQLLSEAAMSGVKPDALELLRLERPTLNAAGRL